MNSHPSTWNSLRPALLAVFLMGIAAMLFMPVMPIDETRYQTVAWEMHNNHTWLVPLLNGLPYSHKPPLLFWIIRGLWTLIGVHDAAARLASIGASLLSIWFTFKISLRIWPGDRKTAAFAALILATTGIWLVWSGAIMFDVLLTAWVLLAVLGTLRLAETQRSGWLLLMLGTAGGLLTKGPIALVYILPVTLLGQLWTPELPEKWHLKTGSAILCGLGAALLWAVPAAIAGGKTYASSIFWSQSVGRMSRSFAHHRPIWWYLPLIPAVLFPWSMLLPSLPGPRNLLAEKAPRLTLIWMLAPLLILSLISGKQIHYLIPILPAAALLSGRIASQAGAFRKTGTRLIGGAYLLAGLTASVLPFITLGSDVGRLTPGSTLPAALSFTAAGAFLLFRKFSIKGGINAVAACTVFVLLSTLCGAKNTIMEGYNIKRMACFIKEQTDAGRTVANVGTYHGQYQFLGRLTRPLPVVDRAPAAQHNFIVEHPNAILISYCDLGKTPPNATILCSQKYKDETVIAWTPAPQLAAKEPHENPAD